MKNIKNKENKEKTHTPQPGTGHVPTSYIASIYYTEKNLLTRHLSVYNWIVELALVFVLSCMDFHGISMIEHSGVINISVTDKP